MPLLAREIRLHPTIDFQAKAFRHQYIELNQSVANSNTQIKQNRRMQWRAPGRRTKVPKGPGAVVRSLSGARTVREGPRNGSDRTRRRPTKEGRDRARRRARRGTARSESRGPPEGTEADDRVLTLLVGVLHAVRKEAFNLRRLREISPVVGRDGLNRILGRNIAVEVEDLCLELDDAYGSDWKSFGDAGSTEL